MRQFVLTGLCLAACVDADLDTVEHEVTHAGLSAEYFRSTTFEPNQRVLARIEPTIDQTYAWGSPAPVVPVDGFGVRWSGALVPRYSQTYTLTIGCG